MKSQISKSTSLQTPPLHVALMGNPNAGKTTIFNALTGMNQHVGNWPGKTVEKKEGFFRHDGREVRIVDLPGTYSLGAFSPEEAITRNYLLDTRPEVVIIVLDAANLERNLFLAVQVLELGVTAVLVLNMMDAAIAQGIEIDTAVLSQRLSIPVVKTVARKERGLAELKTAVLALTPATIL